MTGRCWEFDADGKGTLHYATEDDLQEGLADYAATLGLDVKREVDLYGQGRADLLLTLDGGARLVVVEVKKELTKPAKVRAAIQQADFYGRLLADRRAVPVSTILYAPEIDWSVVGRESRLYLSVDVFELHDVLSTFRGAAFTDDVAIERAIARRNFVLAVTAPIAATVEPKPEPEVPADA